MPSASRRRTAIAWLGVLVLLLALAALVLWPRPRSGELATVERGVLRVERSDRGTTRFRDIHPLVAPAAGVLERIPLEPGDAVSAGQPVARLRPLAATPLDARSLAAVRAELGAAQAAVRQAQAAADSARDARVRLDGAAGRGLVSERELSAARSTEAEAVAAVAVARARQREVEARLALQHPDAEGRIALAAPIDGVLLRRAVQGEQTVAAGQLLVEIGDPATLEVVGDFLSQDAVGFVPGAPARIEAWGGAALAARVQRVEPLGTLKVSALGVEEQRVNVILGLDAPPATLGHGYQVEVAISVREVADAVLVPVESLRREAEGWSVWKLVDGRLQRQPLRVGDSDGRRREVLEGLAPGDRVLRYPPAEDLSGQRFRGIDD